MNTAVRNTLPRLMPRRFGVAHLLLALRTAAYVSQLPLQFRRSSLPAILERFGQAPVRLDRGSLGLQDTVRLVARVCQLGVFRVPIFPRACLRQSLVLYRVLNQLGYSVRIHFGVRQGDVGLEGHSWITVDGQTVAEPAKPDSFVNVYSYPQPKCEEAHG